MNKYVNEYYWSFSSTDRPTSIFVETMTLTLDDETNANLIMEQVYNICIKSYEREFPGASIGKHNINIITLALLHSKKI